MDAQVLIIDDDELDRMSYMRGLKASSQNQFQFIEAKTPQEGLALCQTTQPDCLLIDYDMPGMNGFELLESLKERELLNDIAVVFLTGHGNEHLAVEAMKRGAHDYISKASMTPQRLNAAIEDAMIKSRLLKELKDKNKQIEELAFQDPLTGLLNQTAFEASVKTALANAKRHNHNLALLFIDLDHFKNVNDTMGHDVGDLLLKEVAERMQSCLREEDILARMGGDEFAIALTELRSEDDAGLVAQKIIEVLIEKFILNRKEAHIGASIGIATYPETDNSLIGLLKYADIAMYRAKEVGRNNYQYFSADLHHQHIVDMEIENALRFAVERKELYMEYQPQFDLETNKVIGLEALLRWHHPKLGYIPPDKIFRIADEAGLCGAIGQWVVETVCREYSEYLHREDHPLSISINASPRQLSSEQFINVFKHAIASSSLKAEQIEIEVTEVAIIDDIEKTKTYLDTLRALGVYIAIDDFGTGYSSLRQLRDFLPIETLKIDKSFIHNVIDDKHDARLTQSIIDLARNLKMRVIAEGVESEEQIEFLKNHGCKYAQGYFLSKPTTAEKIQQLLK